MQADPQRPHHLPDRPEFRIAFARQRTVEAFARQAGFAGQPRHAVRACDHAERVGNEAIVVTGLGQAGAQVGGDFCFVAQLCGRVPRAGWFFHGSLQVKIRREVACPVDISVLGRLVAAAEKNDKNFTASLKTDAVAGAVIHPHFKEASAKGFHVAWISVQHAVDSDLDANPGSVVAQGGVPAVERLGCADAEHTTP
ncbi:conserved hypothetical protein [Cupriavidus taiwanensis]|nr:conserved hypothetical protein [Cupriavidus taiwanensis]